MTKWLRWNWRVLGGVVASVLLWTASSALADGLLPKAGTWTFGTRAGYTFGLDDKDVEMVPIHLHIGYTLFNGKPWFLPAGAFEIGIEPFAGVITSTKEKRSGDGERISGSNEFGLGLPMFTYYLDLGGKVAPYVTAGTGIMYKDLRGLDLGGEFTFMETAGVGLAYFINKDVSISAEWRFRHMSNAGIYEENDGLNSSVILAGFSYHLPN